MDTNDTNDASDTTAPGVSERVIAAVDAGKKIEAIKLLREETGLSLKEARDAVESIDRKLHPERATLPIEGGAGGVIKLIVMILIVAAVYFFVFAGR